MRFTRYPVCSCNLQDRSFLLYNLQDSNLLSCNLHDASFLFLWCVMGYWPPSPSTKIPPPKLKPISLENFNHLSLEFFTPFNWKQKHENINLLKNVIQDNYQKKNKTKEIKKKLSKLFLFGSTIGSCSVYLKRCSKVNFPLKRL